MPERAEPQQRWDRLQLPADLAPAERTRQGYLRAHAAVAVPGIMDYYDAAGNLTRELLPAEELHNVDSLLSLASIPMTLHHPDEDVDPDNVGDLGVGDVGGEVEILADTGHVRVGVVIRRRDALDAVDAGMVEVSPGYTTVIVPTPGVAPEYATPDNPEGRYDAIQTRRRYNHLAVVPQARGGDTVRLRADSTARCAARVCTPADPASAVRQRVRLDDTQPPAPPRGPTMHPIMFTLAALCALPVARADDGAAVRTDMEGEDAVMSEGDLIAAISNAINTWKQQAEAGAQQAAEGEDAESLKAKVADLQGQLDVLQKEKADREAVAAEEAEKADCARVDALADSLQIDRAAWPEAATSVERKLLIAQARDLVPADAKADSIGVARLDGMITALQAAAPKAPADAWRDLRVDSKPAEGADWKGPRNRKDGDDAPPTDPLKANIKRKRDAAVQARG